MKPLPCLLAAALALGAPGWASAQTAAPATPTAEPPPVVIVPAPAPRPLPPSRWTAVQIRESFDLADADGNGQLTRAEAQNLTIMPRTFEEADLNKDGVLVRSEYEALFAR
jgi:hypothetical protein